MAKQDLINKINTVLRTARGQCPNFEVAALLKEIVDAIPEPPEPYVLPTASAETLGGVKVGDGLQISEGGVLSSSGGGNEPLIVEGTIDGDNFTRNEGQPTLVEAQAAIAQGRDVIINNEGSSYYHWATSNPDELNIMFFSSGGYIIWAES